MLHQVPVNGPVAQWGEGVVVLVLVVRGARGCPHCHTNTKSQI